MEERERVKAVVAVLKRRFNNLGAEELIELAYDVLAAVNGARYHAHLLGVRRDGDEPVWVQCTGDECTISPVAYPNAGPKLMTVPVLKGTT